MVKYSPCGVFRRSRRSSPEANPALTGQHRSRSRRVKLTRTRSARQRRIVAQGWGVFKVRRIRVPLAFSRYRYRAEADLRIH